MAPWSLTQPHLLDRVLAMTYLTWNDLHNREDAAYFSEAIELCKAEALTPHQVASLLAGGVLRDDVEVEEYDDWSEGQTGDYGYEDRYTPVEDDDELTNWQILDLFSTVITKLAEHKERIDAVQEWQDEAFERIAGLETEQARRAISGIPVFARVIATN